MSTGGNNATVSFKLTPAYYTILQALTAADPPAGARRQALNWGGDLMGSSAATRLRQETKR